MAKLHIFLVLSSIVTFYAFYTPKLTSCKYFKSNLFSSASEDVTLESIRNEVEKYMNDRKNDDIEQKVIVITSYEQLKPVKKSNPFEFLQPTGWYKDKVQLDIDSRSDKNTPLVTHPLSYVELQKYGYEELSPKILALGGPDVVGKLLNIEWQQPIIEDKIPKRAVKKQVEEKAGRLSLGGSFDNLMEERVASLDISAINTKIDLTATLSGDDSISIDYNILAQEYINEENDRNNQQSADDDDLGTDYKNLEYRQMASKTSKTLKSMQLKPKKYIDPSIKEEKFKLDGLERVYTILMLLSFTVGYGRSTNDVINILTSTQSSYTDYIILIQDITHTLFPMLILVSFINAIRSQQLATQNKRNPIVWSLRSFLGGPGVLNKLQKLPALSSPTSSSS